MEGLNVRRFADFRLIFRPDFGLIFRLRRCLIILEGNNLGLEFVVELLQYLPFTNDILAIENRLLPITI